MPSSIWDLKSEQRYEFLPQISQNSVFAHTGSFLRTRKHGSLRLLDALLIEKLPGSLLAFSFSIDTLLEWQGFVFEGGLSALLDPKKPSVCLMLRDLLYL